MTTDNTQGATWTIRNQEQDAFIYYKDQALYVDPVGHIRLGPQGTQFHLVAGKEGVAFQVAGTALTLQVVAEQLVIQPGIQYFTLIPVEADETLAVAPTPSMRWLFIVGILVVLLIFLLLLIR